MFLGFQYLCCKESTCYVGHLVSIPGLGWSPEGRHGTPLLYSCLENLHGQWGLVGLQCMGSQRAGHNQATEHILYKNSSKLEIESFLNLMKVINCVSNITFYGRRLSAILPKSEPAKVSTLSILNVFPWGHIRKWLRRYLVWKRRIILF